MQARKFSDEAPATKAFPPSSIERDLENHEKHADMLIHILPQYPDMNQRRQHRQDLLTSLS